MKQPAGVNRRLRSIVRQMAQVRAVFVGDLVADQYLFGETERISREAPVLIVRYEREEVRLGGAANAAHNARALAAQVTAVGVLGRDPVGRLLATRLQELGLHLAAVTGPGVQTETKTRVLAGGLSTTRQQMLRIDRGQLGPLPAPARKALARVLARQLKGCDVAVVSDYGAGVLCDETRRVLADHARAGGLVCVDSRYALKSFPGATVLKPNEPELAALTGMPVATDAQVLRAGQAALNSTQVQVVLVTRGRKGMALFERGKVPALMGPHGQAEAVDVTGAGDTVVATFALALAAGARPREAAELANRSGALVVQKPGTATVSVAELLRELRP